MNIGFEHSDRFTTISRVCTNFQTNTGRKKVEQTGEKKLSYSKQKNI
jgi:hypothetical protein